MEKALALALAMPYPYGEARTLYVSGLLHTHKGEPARTREHLQAAPGILNRMGEHPYAEHIQQALASLAAEYPPLCLRTPSLLNNERRSLF